MFHVNFQELVIGGFQCAKPGHTPDFRKTRPDARTGPENEDVSGGTETRTYGKAKWCGSAFAEDGSIETPCTCHGRH